MLVGSGGGSGTAVRARAKASWRISAPHRLTTPLAACRRLSEMEELMGHVQAVSGLASLWGPLVWRMGAQWAAEAAPPPPCRHTRQLQTRCPPTLALWRRAPPSRLS